jgi:hypothetical protein
MKVSSVVGDMVQKKLLANLFAAAAVAGQQLALPDTRRV